MEIEQIITFLTGSYCYPVFICLMIFCGMGFPLSAELTMVFMGSLSAIGKVSPEALIFLAIIGLSIGDSITFFMGKKGGLKLLKYPPFSFFFKANKVYKMAKFITKNGPAVVFLVRFLPGARTVTFFSSGVFQMDYKVFFRNNLLGLIFLVPPMVLIGHFFISNLEQAKSNILPIIVSLISIVLIFIFLKRHIQKVILTE